MIYVMTHSTYLRASKTKSISWSKFLKLTQSGRCELQILKMHLQITINRLKPFSSLYDEISRLLINLIKLNFNDY